jgi:hypothetical protein
MKNYNNTTGNRTGDLLAYCPALFMFDPMKITPGIKILLLEKIIGQLVKK